jgi:nucleoside-diphosphate-sugar epimerase
MVCKAADVDKPVVSRNNRRVNDIPDVIADIAAIRNAVGWSPSVALPDGLRGMVDQVRSLDGSGAII